MFEEITERFFQLEAELGRVCAGMRVELSRAEEENRRLRAQVENFELVIHTEEEAAAILRMSQDTLQRLRKRKNLPHLREGQLVRYTRAQLVRITQMLEVPRLSEVKRRAS